MNQNYYIFRVLQLPLNVDHKLAWTAQILRILFHEGNLGYFPHNASLKLIFRMLKLLHGLGLLADLLIDSLAILSAVF